MQGRWFVMLAGLAMVAPAAWAAPGHAGHSVAAMALYSQGAAVIQDSRSVQLERGEQTLAWPVAGPLQPETFWLSGSGVALDGFEIPARNKASEGPLADRVGQQVMLRSPDGHERQGLLVAAAGDTAYVRIHDRIERITAASPVQISWRVGRKQDNDGAESDVLLHINANKAGEQTLTALYQSESPRWQASYTARFDPNSGQLKLTAQAVIDNSGHSGFDADRAWLVAGAIARVSGGQPRPLRMAKRAASEAAPAAQPQAVGDIYRYPLPAGLHIPAGAVQTVALMKPLQVKAKRHYRFESPALRDSGETRRHAQLRLAFENAADRPLPAGVIRVYATEHAAQLLGAAQISDTPAGAPVRLVLGRAFDITATHRVVGNERRADGTRLTTVRIDLYNASDQAHPVRVAEHLPANAQLVEGAPDPRGGSATRPEWRVNVPANGHKTLLYSFTQQKS
jgi:hypothetical protein